MVHQPVRAHAEDELAALADIGQVGAAILIQQILEHDAGQIVCNCLETRFAFIESSERGFIQLGQIAFNDGHESVQPLLGHDIGRAGFDHRRCGLLADRVGYDDHRNSGFQRLENCERFHGAEFWQIEGGEHDIPICGLQSSAQLLGGVDAPADDRKSTGSQGRDNCLRVRLGILDQQSANHAFIHLTGPESATRWVSGPAKNPPAVEDMR